jgi:hypothetical protein
VAIEMLEREVLAAPESSGPDGSPTEAGSAAN